MQRISIVILLVALCVGFTSTSLAQGGLEYNGWAEEEATVSKTMKLWAEVLEKKTGIHFDKDTKFKAAFEYQLGNGQPGFNLGPRAQYFFEDQSIRFRSWLIADINKRHRSSLRSMDPATLAKDREIGKDATHELGHLLMDQIYRANKLGIWYTIEYIENAPPEERLGVQIVSEGVAEYCKYSVYPTEEKFSEDYFPSNAREARVWPFESMAYSGGYWLVRDVLKEHGKNGLLWIMKNPFIANTDNMREAAVAYRERALAELVEQKKKEELAKQRLSAKMAEQKKKSPCQK